MGICSFPGAKDIARLIRSLVARLLDSSGAGEVSLNPDHVGTLLGWFEVILFAILEVNRVTDSRVTDALRDLYTAENPQDAPKIMSRRDLAAAEFYHAVAARLPLSEDDREMVMNGRAPRAAMMLAEAASEKLQELGYGTDLFHTRKVLLEFLRSPVWEEMIA